MSTIRPFRSQRGSVPITADLYASTNDPVVVAFQLAAGFYDPRRDPPLTLGGLRKRWRVGLPAARTARRRLIDLGWWAEVNTFATEDDQGQRFPRPQRCTTTRTSETRYTEDDLRDLAAEYPPGTRIDCGAVQYVITTAGNLVHADETDSEKTDGRSEQGKRGVPAGRTDRQKTAPNVCMDDQKHACMDDFWKLIAQIARVDPPGRRAVDQHVKTALSSGWTEPSLAEWASAQLRARQDRSAVSNPGGFVVSLLKEIPSPAELRKPMAASGRRGRVVLRACEVCGANEDTPADERQVYVGPGVIRHCECTAPLRQSTPPSPVSPASARSTHAAENAGNSGNAAGPVNAADNPLALAGLAT